MLHVGLDLSRRRVDVCLISSEGELVEHFRAPADRDGLYGLSRRVAVYDERVRGVVESMNGARFVHDELVRYGWEVLVADAQRVKGLAPLACKTDKIDARVLAELSFRDLVPAIWLPTPELRQERERSRWRLHLVKHRSILKNRVHASLIAFGHQVPMADLFGVAGRRHGHRSTRAPTRPRSIAPPAPIRPELRRHPCRRATASRKHAPSRRSSWGLDTGPSFIEATTGPRRRLKPHRSSGSVRGFV
jgi:Transposase